MLTLMFDCWTQCFAVTFFLAIYNYFFYIMPFHCTVFSAVVYYRGYN